MAPRDGGDASQYPRVAAAETGPGPGAYSLPPLVGNGADTTRRGAPKWTLKMPQPAKYNDAPAPGYWPDDNKLPAVSLKGRNFYNPKKLTTPAPGYKNESLKFPTMQCAPAYTMGTRTRNRKLDQVPAATAYTLPTMIGGRNGVSKSEPNWGMSFTKPEHTSYSYDATKGPGPAAYATGPTTDSVKYRTPRFSMAPRTTLPKDKTAKPGPGSYNPGTVTMHKRKAPSFSMGTRHSQFAMPVITAADIY